MSLQIEINKDVLVEEIEKLINNEDYQEIIISKTENDLLSITADNKTFWLHALTPYEASKLKRELSQAKEKISELEKKLSI